jgi:hypothetical protein
MKHYSRSISQRTFVNATMYHHPAQQQQRRNSSKEDEPSINKIDR